MDIQFFSNGWVIGIGSGILSGFAVFFVTRLLFSNQSAKEIQRLTAVANTELVQAIRQGIPEEYIPTSEVIEALIRATARRHNLAPSQLLDVSELSDELIKEVIDSSFLSSKSKGSYCRALEALGSSETVLRSPDGQPSTEANRNLASGVSMSGMEIGLLLGLLSGLATAGMALDLRDILPWDDLQTTVFDNPVVALLAPAAVSISAAAVFSALLQARKRSRQMAHQKQIIDNIRTRRPESGPSEIIHAASDEEIERLADTNKH